MEAIGEHYIWNAVYAGTAWAHTVARVLVTGIDLRPLETGEDAYIVYLVDGVPPRLASCWLSHFRRSCLRDLAPNPWSTATQRETALAWTLHALNMSHMPGEYTFPEGGIISCR